jgi:hypothetical protein
MKLDLTGVAMGIALAVGFYSCCKTVTVEACLKQTKSAECMK